MALWNVTFKVSDRKKFYDYCNKLAPGAFNERREIPEIYKASETTMIEMPEEDALMMQLAVQVKLEKLE